MFQLVDMFAPPEMNLITNVTDVSVKLTKFLQLSGFKLGPDREVTFPFWKIREK